MTNTNELTAKLKAAAQKATALNLDTAQVKRGNGGYLECPCCEGAGYVEEENDFCNIDGVALGVQFYGIGPHHGLAEEYLREANPANILALTEALEAAEKRIAELEAKLEAADKLQDSSFRHGLQHGFSLGQTDNQAGFEECLSAYGTRGKDNG